MSETYVEVRQKSAVLVAEDGAKYLVEICYQSTADWENIRSALDSLLSGNSKLQRQVEDYIASSRYLIQRADELVKEAMERMKNYPPAYLIYCGQCSELTEREHIAGFCPKCGYLCQPCEKEHSWVLSVLQGKGGQGDAQ